MNQGEKTQHCHQGYLDGLRGNDPEEVADRIQNEAYVAGWVHGDEDRQNGMTDALLVDFEGKLSKGSKVVIPKGVEIRTVKYGTRNSFRRYPVQIHRYEPGCGAYVAFGGEFKRPRPPEVIWPGKNGYWSSAYAAQVEIAPT